jgi:hypothetical protein
MVSQTSLSLEGPQQAEGSEMGAPMSMAEDLVKRLSEAHANSTQRILGSDIFEAAADLIEQQAASLAAKGKEIEARDVFIKELSDALIAVRPLGGSELFVKRFGRYYADPAYCKAAIVKDADARHEAMSGLVRHRRRAEQAESALAVLAPVRDMLILCGELGGIQPDEGMSGYLRRLIDGVIDGQQAADKTKDEICEALLVISDGWKQQGNSETATAISNAAVFTCGLERTKRIGRAFVAQHSREGK